MEVRKGGVKESPEVEAHSEGAQLSVLVRPGAGRSEVLGIRQGALRVAVSAPPEGGKANRELCKFLAKRLGLRQAEVRILGGARDRRKRVLLGGLTPGEALRRLQNL